MSDSIRVRVETGMLGAAVGDVVDLVLTPLVQAAIADHRLTVVDQPDGDAPPVLKGAALDDALRQRGLPLTGSADEKRARLADNPPGDEEELAVVVTSDGVEHVGVLPASAAVSPAGDAAPINSDQ